MQAKELLAEEEKVTVAELSAAAEADVAAVGAADVGEGEFAASGGELAVEARDVAVVGEENVTAFAAEVEAGDGNGKGAREAVAAGDEDDFADEAVDFGAELFGAVGRASDGAKGFETQDFLADTEDVSVADFDGLLAADADVDAVERTLVTDGNRAVGDHEGGVVRREKSVLREGPAGGAADGVFSVGQRPRSAVGAVGEDQHEARTLGGGGSCRGLGVAL